MADITWLTKTEAAERLSIHVRTIDRWASAGLLKLYRQGGIIRFKAEDVDAAMMGEEPRR